MEHEKDKEKEKRRKFSILWFRWKEYNEGNKKDMRETFDSAVRKHIIYVNFASFFFYQWVLIKWNMLVYFFRCFRVFPNYSFNEVMATQQQLIATCFSTHCQKTPNLFSSFQTFHIRIFPFFTFATEVMVNFITLQLTTSSYPVPCTITLSVSCSSVGFRS